MGCTSSLPKSGCKRRKMETLEVAVFIPTLWVPSQIYLQRPLKRLVPQHVMDRLVALRTRIALVAQDTDGCAIGDLKAALQEYLSILLGFTNKEMGLEDSVKFRWTSMDDRRREACISNVWFEVLCVIYMLAVLTLSEANKLLIPKLHSGDSSSQMTVSLDCQRDAIDLLLKAAGYLDFCVKKILAPLPPDSKEKLPAEMQDGALQALSIQAIGQGTELQLGLAVENKKATLSVKRRLACEELAFFSQARFLLLGCDLNETVMKKHLAFVQWKYLEAKAAAYYYHGLIIEKGSDPQNHVSAVRCFLASQEHLSDSNKSCLSFSSASPLTRPSPPWGLMKVLQQKIPDMASKKLQAYSYLLHQENGPHTVPDLPEFLLSLRADDYELPTIDPAWN